MSKRSDDRNDDRSERSRDDDRNNRDRSQSGNRNRDERSNQRQQASNRDGDRGNWRSFGERLAERKEQSATARLTDRLHDLRDRRESSAARMPLAEVKEARALVKDWKPEQVSDKTLAHYSMLNERMNRTGQKPEQIAGTRGSFQIYRASVVHQARTELRDALKERDAILRTQKIEKSVRKSARDSAQKPAHDSTQTRADLRATEARIRDAVKTLERYPPGTGNPQHDMQRPSAYRGAAHSDRSNGKRDALDQRPADWRDRLWGEIKERDKDAVAVTALTGARPAELVKGVRVQHEQNGDLKFTIKGAKLGDDRGQQVRTITVSRAEAAKSVEGRHLLAEINQGQGRTVQIGDPKNFSDRVRHASERAMPDQRTVSPYDFRHAFASRLKDDPRLDASDRAAALGQQAERSQEAYGRASSAGRSGAGSISSARASSSTRAGR